MELQGLLLISLLAGSGQDASESNSQGELPSPEAASTAQLPADTNFVPPVPGTDDFDWIRLKSGEWLKGEIVGLRDGSLEFDSDELDDLKLDIDDVAYARSSRQLVIQIEDREDLTGTLLIEDGVVTVGGPGGGSLERELMMSIVPQGRNWWDAWSGDLGLGYTRRSGNSSQTDLTANIFLRRRTSATRWDSTYNGADSRTGGTQTADNHRLNSRFDYFLTRRLYLTPVSVTALQDRFTNIDYQVSPSAGLGYDLLDHNTLSWEVDLGLGYQFTRYESVLPGQASGEDSFAMFAGTGLEWDITPDVEFDLGYQIVMPMPDTDEYNHHVTGKLSVDLVGWMDVDLTAIWDRINSPLPDANNNVPEPDDFRITFGISVDF